jgi:L-iditol 2-dehydrogenase
MPLPDEISFVGGAAVSCGTGTAYGVLMRLDISARETLAVFGLGPVRLSAAQLAAAVGVEVIGVDISPEPGGALAQVRRRPRHRRLQDRGG